jgi:C-terminal processing protease CtpA/Prc
MAVLAVILAGRTTSTAGTNGAPDFREVYDLIRAHATGVSEADLNRAAVQGLVTGLAPKVSFVRMAAATNDSPETLLVSRVGLLEADIAYLRINCVSDGLARDLSAACLDLASTNRVKGLVLDLRYADGADYAAAAAAADLFTAKAAPLLNWGGGPVSSHDKTNALRMPVAVLVNGETARAAEALAAMLRHTGAGLILGNRTAGRAMITQDYPLKNGEQLRLATSPVLLGDGSPLPAQGIKPDIEVKVSPEEEKAFFADTRLVLSNRNADVVARLSPTNPPAGTNAEARRGRMNEAELVREHRQALEPGLVRMIPGAPPARPAEPDQPPINDPVLARGLDLLKGLAVVRQDRF